MRFGGLATLAVLAVAAMHTPVAANGPRAAVSGHAHGGAHGTFAGPRHGFHDGRFFRHHNNSVVVFAPIVPFGFDPFLYSSAPSYDPPPAYAQQTPVYQPQATSYYQPPAPPAPPTQTVINYATGRYELRGDGISTPYVWVWIPNPPPGPPPPPVYAPPAPEPPPGPTGSSARRTPHVAYRWTDDRGVTTWTDNPETIPAQYRSSAKPTQP
jgi:hypothetical protein